GEVCGGETSSCSGASQDVVYDAPLHPGLSLTKDINVLSLLVNGHDGADDIYVASTNGDVPVTVDAGAGDDVITVGDGTLTGIVGVTRPGLNNPYGVGPLAIV